MAVVTATLRWADVPSWGYNASVLTWYKASGLANVGALDADDGASQLTRLGLAGPNAIGPGWRTYFQATGDDLTSAWETSESAIKLSNPNITPDLVIPGPNAPGSQQSDTTEPYAWRPPAAVETAVQAWITAYRALTTTQRDQTTLTLSDVDPESLMLLTAGLEHEDAVVTGQGRTADLKAGLIHSPIVTGVGGLMRVDIGIDTPEVVTGVGGLMRVDIGIDTPEVVTGVGGLMRVDIGAGIELEVVGTGALARLTAGLTHDAIGVGALMEYDAGLEHEDAVVTGQGALASLTAGLEHEWIVATGRGTASILTAGLTHEDPEGDRVVNGRLVRLAAGLEHFPQGIGSLVGLTAGLTHQFPSRTGDGALMVLDAGLTHEDAVAEGQGALASLTAGLRHSPPSVATQGGLSRLTVGLEHTAGGRTLPPGWEERLPDAHGLEFVRLLEMRADSYAGDPPALVPQVLRFTDAGVDVEWSGHVWSAGQVLDFGPVSESVDLGRQSVGFEVSGVDQSLIAVAVNAQIRGRDCTLWLAMFRDGAIVPEPVLLFRGPMNGDLVGREALDTATLTFTAVSRMVGVERDGGRPQHRGLAPILPPAARRDGPGRRVVPVRTEAGWQEPGRVKGHRPGGELEGCLRTPDPPPLPTPSGSWAVRRERSRSGSPSRGGSSTAAVVPRSCASDWPNRSPASCSARIRYPWSTARRLSGCDRASSP